MSLRLSGPGSGVEVFVGRQSVTFGPSGLCSDVSSVGGYGKYVGDVVHLVYDVYICLVISCWVEGVVIYSLARRLRSVAMLRNVSTSFWTVFFTSGV